LPLQFFAISYISSYVGREFLFPKINIRARSGRLFAVLMAVPKAAMNENDRPPSRQYQIRFAWQFPIMQTKAEPKAMSSRAHDQFGAGIFGTYRPHNFRTLLAGDSINHDLQVDRQSGSSKGCDSLL